MLAAVSLDVNFQVVHDEVDTNGIIAMRSTHMQIINYVQQIKPNSNLKAKYRQYEPSSFTPTGSNPPQFDWVKDAKEISAFEASLEKLGLFRESGDAALQANIGDVLHHIDIVQPKLGGVGSNERLYIVMFGQQSTGKSTAVEFLIGFDIAFKAPGMATKSPVMYNIYRRPGGTQFYVGKDDSSGVPLTKKEITTATANHMHSLTAIVGTVFNVAIYTDNPLFEGELLDLPGFQSNVASNANAQVIADNDKVFDIIENLLLNSNSQSIFICNEAITKGTTTQHSSIDKVVTRFKSNTALLKKLEERMLLIINQANNLFDANGNWNLGPTEEDAFHQYNLLLLDHLNSFTSYGFQPIMIGLNHNNLQSAIGSTLSDFDQNLGSMIQLRVDNYYTKNPNLPHGVDASQNYVTKINFGSLTSLLSYVKDKRLKAIKDILKDLDSRIDNFIIKHASAAIKSSIYNQDVFNALSNAHKRFKTILMAFSSNEFKSSNTITGAIYIDTSNKPKLVDYLLDPKNDIFNTFDGAKYKVFKNDFTDKNNEMEKAFAAGAQHFMSSFAKPQEVRTGLIDMSMFAAEMLASMVSISLEQIDVIQVQRVESELDIRAMNRPLMAIEKTVMKDFLKLSSIFLDYFEASLLWYFGEIVKHVFFLDRVEIAEHLGQTAVRNAIDVDISSAQMENRVTLAFQSWVKDICKKMRLEVLQGTTHSLFGAALFAKNSINLLSSVKAFEILASNSAVTGKFPDLLMEFLQGSATTLSRDELHKQMLEGWFLHEVDINHVFSIGDYTDPTSNDWGQKFFDHLKLNFLHRLQNVLVAQLQYFADETKSSGKELHRKIYAFIFYQVGKPLLQTANSVIDSHMQDVYLYSDDLYVIPTNQTDYLLQLYKWDAKYSPTGTYNYVLLLDLYKRLVKKCPFYKRVLQATI